MPLVYDFQELHKTNIISPIRLIHPNPMTQLVRMFYFQSPCGVGEALTTQQLAQLRAGDANSAGVYFVPQNLIQGKSIAALPSDTDINVETLRDGVSRVQTPFRINDYIRVYMNNTQYNHISIYNPSGSSGASAFKLILLTSQPFPEYIFPMTGYSSFILLPQIYSCDFYIKNVSNYAALLGEVYAGLTRSPKTQPDRAVNYNDGFKFTPEVIGSSQKSESGSPAKLSRGKRRNFELSWKIQGDTNRDWWEDLLYDAHKHKSVNNGAAWWGYPICVVMDGCAYLMDVDFSWPLNNTAEQQYEISINLQQEGLKL